MKKNINRLNFLLLCSLPILLLTVNIKTNTIDSNINTKALATNLFSKVEQKDIVAIKEETEEEKIDLVKTEINKEESKEKKIENNLSTNVLEKEEQKKEESIIQTTDVLAAYTGKMSFYQANCRGCSGITSTGVDISDGKLYYYDKTYGNVRIVAAGEEIKKWSIIRIKNSSLGSNILAIVLDRGGAIGIGKTFLIDMLTNTSENKDGIEKNITVEILRDGV